MNYQNLATALKELIHNAYTSGDERFADVETLTNGPVPHSLCLKLSDGAELRIVCEPVGEHTDPSNELHRGINPVTLRPTRPECKLNVTIGRLYIQPGGGAIQKPVTFVMWEEGKDPDVLTIIDEDTVIHGLLHLFPNGELNRRPPQ